MKKLFLLCFVIVPMLVFGQKAKIEFTTTSHNFGKISETGGNAVFDFVFKNTGNVPLILTNVRAGCGCTTPEWSSEPIAPHATGVIKVSYNPLRRPGAFTKSVTVNSNAENSVVSLTIRGVVERRPADPYAHYTYNVGGLKVSASNINFGTVNNTSQVEKSLEMVNTGSRPLKVTVTTESVTTEIPAVTVAVKPETLSSGQKGEIIVKYNAAAKNDWGFVSDRLQITTDHGAKGDIVVVANITEDFSVYKNNDYANAPVAVFSEEEYDLGVLEKNASRKHEFYIQNNGKSDLIIRKIRTSDDETISVTPARNVIKPGKKTKVTLVLKTDAEPGKKSRIVSFTFNDPKNTILSYKLTGNVE